MDTKKDGARTQSRLQALSIYILRNKNRMSQAARLFMHREPACWPPWEALVAPMRAVYSCQPPLPRTQQQQQWSPSRGLLWVLACASQGNEPGGPMRLVPALELRAAASTLESCLSLLRRGADQPPDFTHLLSHYKRYCLVLRDVCARAKDHAPDQREAGPYPSSDSLQTVSIDTKSEESNEVDDLEDLLNGDDAVDAEEVEDEGGDGARKRVMALGRWDIFEYFHAPPGRGLKPVHIQ